MFGVVLQDWMLSRSSGSFKFVKFTFGLTFRGAIYDGCSFVLSNSVLSCVIRHNTRVNDVSTHLIEFI
jgi:hypothetical protein